MPKILFSICVLTVKIGWVMKDSLVTSSSRAQTGTTCKIVSARISSRFEKNVMSK